MINFTEEEMLLLAVNPAETRKESLDYFKEILPLADDEEEPEMKELIDNVIRKLQLISDEDYQKLDYTDYDVWLEDIQAEDKNAYEDNEDNEEKDDNDEI